MNLVICLQMVGTTKALQMANILIFINAFVYNVGGILFEWNRCRIFTFLLAFGLNAVYTIKRRQFEEAEDSTDSINLDQDEVDGNNISVQSIAAMLNEIPSLSIYMSDIENANQWTNIDRQISI